MTATTNYDDLRRCPECGGGCSIFVDDKWCCIVCHLIKKSVSGAEIDGYGPPRNEAQRID